MVHEHLKGVFLPVVQLDLRAQQHVTRKVCIDTSHPPHAKQGDVLTLGPRRTLKDSRLF